MTFALYLKLVRWKNLALLVYLLCLLRFILLNTYQIPLKLHNIQFLFLVLSIVSIAGAGYIINDIKDVIADSINKPKQLIVGQLIGLEQAKRWYFNPKDLSYVVENTLRADCSVPFQDPGPECFSCLDYPFGNSINVKPEWWR